VRIRLRRRCVIYAESPPSFVLDLLLNWIQPTSAVPGLKSTRPWHLELMQWLPSLLTKRTAHPPWGGARGTDEAVSPTLL